MAHLSVTGLRKTGDAVTITIHKKGGENMATQLRMQKLIKHLPNGGRGIGGRVRLGR